MRQTVCFPHVVLSPNKLRYASRFVVYREVERDRQATRNALRAIRFKPDLSDVRKIPGVVVTFTRFAAGQLDKEDNLPASFKAVKDEVADWFGLPDNDDRFVWRYAQGGAPLKSGGTMITFEDDREGPEYRDVLAGFPERLGAVSDRRTPLPKQTKQTNTPGLPAFIKMPWGNGGATRLQIPATGEPLAVVVPIEALRAGAWLPGSTVRFVARVQRTAKYGPVWMYEPDEETLWHDRKRRKTK